MDKDKYRVSIIVPNYDRKGDLEILLPGILNQTFADYELIVIDDCSPDKSAVDYINDFIQGRHNMRLVENKENLGFVRTCNLGIKLANGDYICILTNDTEVKRDFIQRNVEIMDTDSSIGVLSCVIVDVEGRNWFSGGTMKSGYPVNMKDDFTGVRPVDFVAGTAPFYRREVFEQVGLLNEDLYMYHEDVEFCLRVNRRTNYRSCMFGEKLVTHHVGIADYASYKVNYYLHRNLILVTKKYSSESIPRVLLHYLREKANLLLVSVLKLNPRYLWHAIYIIRGTLDGLRTKIK